jgi:2,5-furandicarboxylate decarboxylase 1
MNQLLICEREVNSEYELGAVLKSFENKRPILFNKVKKSPIKVVGGLYGDREVFYNLLNITHENRLFTFMDVIANPKPYKLVSNGPIKENIIDRNIDLSKIFPIPKFQEKDSSSFITAGILVVKDPDTGRHFTSVRRFQINGNNEVSALIASPKLTNDFLELEKLDRPMDVAIILGYDAPFLLASQISSFTYGVDKYEVDSALREKPLELVKCKTVDLLVPAYSEIVLEGKILPNKRKIEGPFGELMGYYGEAANHPIIEIDLVMHRNNPIFQVAFPCREEHLSNGLIREVELYNSLRNQVDVEDVYVTEGGGYRFNAFVSINKHQEGDGKSAIIAALGSNKDLKQVVVVDEDVDIFSLKEIEWAITTRSQASEDLVVIKGGLGSSLEPSHGIRGVTDKVGIDATKPLGEKGLKFERAIIPNYENIDIHKYFPNIE